MTIAYQLSLIQILDLDEKNQVLTTNVWSTYVSYLVVVQLSELWHKYLK
ncbi:UNVERIFIED_CONTAM: hypothetical protein GTU68_062802 [Idotea baltica]|nr:hypothetical protein [Idotea baltica]